MEQKKKVKPDRVEIREGEMEALIATRSKMGYMLNFDLCHPLANRRLIRGADFDRRGLMFQEMDFYRHLTFRESR